MLYNPDNMLRLLFQLLALCLYLWKKRIGRHNLSILSKKIRALEYRNVTLNWARLQSQNIYEIKLIHNLPDQVVVLSLLKSD